MDNFCIFIISHGRPDKVLTWNTLKKAGVQMPVYVLIDDTDSNRALYEKNFKGRVLVFDKKRMAAKVDNGDNFDNLRTTTHARNACFDEAMKLGFEYFLVLDDDYKYFSFRMDGGCRYLVNSPKIKTTLTDVIKAHLEFYMGIDALAICVTQGGDFVAGESSAFVKNGYMLRRKAMNSFFCCTRRRFYFMSRLNEDVNTVLVMGNRGGLFATVPFVSLEQMQTQLTKGGMSDAYLESGTYVKSFYSVMYLPSAVRVRHSVAMGRIHHSITWKNAVPVLLSEKWKKK